jgi:hypothetical protein
VADFLRRLLPKAKPAAESADTAPLQESRPAAAASDSPPRSEIEQLSAAIGQSVGKQRQHNEDSLLAITSAIAGKSGSLPFGLYIVADGMGGHQFGEIASNAAIRIMAGGILRKFHPHLVGGLPAIWESVQRSRGVSERAHRWWQEAPGSGYHGCLVLENRSYRPCRRQLPTPW